MPPGGSRWCLQCQVLTIHPHGRPAFLALSFSLVQVGCAEGIWKVNQLDRKNYHLFLYLPLKLKRTRERERTNELWVLQGAPSDLIRHYPCSVEPLYVTPQDFVS